MGKTQMSSDQYRLRAARARAIVYVDGFNLYFGALKGTPYKWLDLDALARRLAPNDDIVAVRYFTARVTTRRSDPSNASVSSSISEPWRLSRRSPCTSASTARTA